MLQGVIGCSLQHLGVVGAATGILVAPEHGEHGNGGQGAKRFIGVLLNDDQNNRPEDVRQDLLVTLLATYLAALELCPSATRNLQITCLVRAEGPSVPRPARDSSAPTPTYCCCSCKSPAAIGCKSLPRAVPLLQKGAESFPARPSSAHHLAPSHLSYNEPAPTYACPQPCPCTHLLQ